MKIKYRVYSSGGKLPRCYFLQVSYHLGFGNYRNITIAAKSPMALNPLMPSVRAMGKYGTNKNQLALWADGARAYLRYKGLKA